MKMLLRIVFFVFLLIGSFLNELISSDIFDKDMEVPFQDVNGLIVVEATLNNKKGKYIFDTGADEIILNGKSEHTTEYFDTSSGPAEASSKKIETFTVGKLTKSHLEVYVIDLSSVESFLQIQLDGIIGSEFFLPNHIMVDFENLTITVSDNGFSELEFEAQQRLTFDLVDDLMIVNCKLENQNLRFALDSGSTSSTLDKTIFEDYFEGKKDFDQYFIELFTAHKDSQKVVKTRFDKLELGEYDINNIEFMISDLDHINVNLQQKIDGIINLKSLQSEKVIINIPERTLYF